VFLDIVQRVPRWLGLRQSGDLDDQHVKQDIRRIVEDLQDHVRVQGTRWNQTRREDHEETSQERELQGVGP
jgi:hypothetical protein